MSGGMDNDNSYECFTCGKHIGAMEVHDKSICKRQQEILNEERRKATYAAVFLKENKTSPTPSDIDLAKTLFSAFEGSSFGIYPNVLEFETYTLKQIKELADIARKIC